MDRQRPRKRWLVAVVVALLATLGTPVSAADDGEIDPVLEATLHLKVQSYDRKLANRIKKRYVIAVLYEPSAPASVDAAHRMTEAFSRVAATYKIKGITPTIAMVAVDANFGDAIKAAEANVLYVTAGLEKGLPQIIATGRELQAPTVTHLREHVRAGIGIAIVADHRKPKIIINLKAIVATGMELDAEMLGFAEVIR